MSAIRSFSLFILLSVFTLQLHSQNLESPVAIGEWKTYLSYGGPDLFALAGEQVYAANGLSVFYVNTVDNSYGRLHKANGLSDVNATGVFYGSTQKTLAISYLNSNLDFITDNKVVNFPYIRTAGISGDKSIQSVRFKGDSAYVSTGFGIVVYDIVRKESPATYFFNDVITSSSISVNDVLVDDSYLYAATQNGLYRGSLSEPLLEDFSKWTMLSGADGLPAGNCNYPVELGGDLYVTVNDQSIYRWDGVDWMLYYTEADWDIRHVSKGNASLQIVLTQGSDILPDAYRLIDLETDGSSTELDVASTVLAPMQLQEDESGQYWIADAFGALVVYDDGNITKHLPNGPASSGVFDMEYFDNKLWVAPGAINASWNYLFNRDGFFVMDYGYWNNYSFNEFDALDTIFDLITMTVDASDGKAYFGSFGGGLVVFDKPNNTLEIFDHTNTGSTGLQEIGAADPGNCRIGGLQFDVNGNLWIANNGATNPLVVRKKDGSWMNFDCALPNDVYNRVGQIAIDDFDQKWVQIPRGGGILVYSHGTDIDDTADDTFRQLGLGAGNGNLPVAYVNCLVKDKDGEIWVGTNEGVTIFYNPGAVMEGGTIADAAQPLVNLGGYNEYLLSKEIINCIAVDGANRKWIGTNSGAFLISEDGTEQLRFFNQDNSPLLSNVIINITIDGSTGEVFLGTDKGIVSYRGTATEGGAAHSQVKVFPNPVRPDYTGPIAISGLVNNAQVKITDTGGRLIFETIALGGQVIWDGKGYNGSEAGTGVYMVYSSDDTGKETYVTKILVIQ